MQEFKCVRGGACLAISLEGLEWLRKRKCSEEEIKKRNGKPYLQISTVSEGSDLQPFYCPSQSSQSSACSHLLNALRNQASSTCTALTLVNSKKNLRTFLRNISDNWFTNYVTVATSPKNRLVILYDKNIIERPFSDTFYCLDHGPGITELNNVTDVFDTDMSDVPINHHHTEDHISERSRRSKSVSFADDVVVHLFDQESSTVELHSESSNSTSSTSCLLSDVVFDNSGLEWEDDFLILENNCNYPSRPVSRRCCTTQNWTERRFFMSQSCLVLTYVTESDLEL